jgi:5-methylcytosine-specific restriction endonuclease McrA
VGTAIACSQCGKMIRARRNVSGKCRECWQASARRIETRVCNGCGSTFSRTPHRLRWNAKGKYCSRECAAKHRDNSSSWFKGTPCVKCGSKSQKECTCKPEPIRKTCVVCGVQFDTTISNQVVCESAECKRKRNADFAATWYRRKYGIKYAGVNVCRVCSRVEVFSKGFSVVEKGLCARCKKRRAKRKQDAKRRGAIGSGDDITLRELYDRDGRRCMMCGRKTRMPGKSGGWFATMASIDHIIPVSLGGPHTWANVQLACQECNTRKCATRKGQMRLFG